MDTEQWIESLDSKDRKYFGQEDKAYFSETTVEEIPQQGIGDESEIY